METDERDITLAEIVEPLAAERGIKAGGPQSDRV